MPPHAPSACVGVCQFLTLNLCSSLTVRDPGPYQRKKEEEEEEERGVGGQFRLQKIILESQNHYAHRRRST